MTDTPTIHLHRPAISSNPFKPDVWGAIVNQNWDLIDAAFTALMARVTELEEGGGGGSGGYSVIVYNGVAMPARSRIEFVGNVTVTDDPGSDTTIVTILGTTPPEEVDREILYRGMPILFRGLPIVLGG